MKAPLAAGTGDDTQLTEATVADPYAPVAPIYDAWQDREGAFFRLVLPKLTDTLARHAVALSSFLDVGCGTGSLLHALRARHPHARLCGVDGSAAMLARARDKPGADDIHWVHARLGGAASDGQSAAAIPGAPYAAAGAFFGVANHILDSGGLRAAFAAVAAALGPGGLFVFDLSNEHGYQAWWTGRRRRVGWGWDLTIDLAYDPSTRLAAADATVAWRLTGRTNEVARIRERYHAPEDVRAALAEVGFALECEEPWSTRPGEIAGKTWYAARLAVS